MIDPVASEQHMRFLARLLTERERLNDALKAIEHLIRRYSDLALDGPAVLMPPAPKDKAAEPLRSAVTVSATPTLPTRPRVAIDPGPAVAMTFDAVRVWAIEHALKFESWEDLPRINDWRETANLARFKRPFGPVQT